jgi:MFS family permease
MSGALRIRLSAMMFLQYAIWGVWAVVLAKYLQDLPSFRDDTFFKIGMIFLTMAIASILSPFIAGQLADRYFSTERFLAFSHLVGGGLILYAYQRTDYAGLFWVMLGHCLLYAPTVPLTNSLSFHHLPNGEKDFGSIRLWGTIGWIAAGWVFAVWIARGAPLFGFEPSLGQSLVFAAGLSFIMAVYCLTLPHTPPAKEVEDPFAFLRAIKLSKDRGFAVMLVVAFLVSTELQFYYVLTPNFFADEPGPSLSLSQLMRAADCDEKQAGQLMRLLDVNNNNKLSEAELRADAQRTQELGAAHQALVAAGGPLTADKLAEALEKAGVVKGPDGKALEGDELKARARAVAAWIINGARGASLTQVTAEEVQKFLDDTKDLGPVAAKALANFTAHATDKGGLGLSDAWLGPVMSIGQIAEILVLLLLPLALSRLGFTLTIAIGIAAWAVRYAAFAYGRPLWLVVTSQSLHGFGFGFFFVGCMIYSDRVAPKDIRASAQSLLIFVTFGVGMLISSLFAGKVADYFEGDWHKIFLVPVAITAVCTLLFLIGFRPTAAPAAAEAPKPKEA